MLNTFDEIFFAEIIGDSPHVNIVEIFGILALQMVLVFQFVYILRHHIFTLHVAIINVFMCFFINQWTKSCPEGSTDHAALMTVIRKTGKVHCPKCNKELHFLHYYYNHLKWCGREVGNFTARI